MADQILRSGEWHAGIPIGRISDCFQHAVRQGLVGPEDTAVLFHDMTLMRDRIETLKAAFPANTLHALAIKANPAVGILRAAVQSGAGLEAASIEEVALARAAGCPADRIVFDSPAKTAAEIGMALDFGVRLNADNAAELRRIDDAVRSRRSHAGFIGLRINPMVGEGAIGTTSVAGQRSKFGMPISDRNGIIAAFCRYRWLNGVHVHVGSQGAPLSLLVGGVSSALELGRSIEDATGRALDWLDIGGGLPARYTDDASPPAPSDYIAALRETVPALFTFPGTLVTEFGRAVQAPCGWAVSRVEYVKQTGDVITAVIHLGADFLLRPVYQPHYWTHRFFVLDSAGKPKQAAKRPVRIVGPLCFGGDVLAEEVLLPEISEGDRIVIRDVGAYTLSMWSRHCNRAIPTVVGALSTVPGDLTQLVKRESADDIVRLWGGA